MTFKHNNRPQGDYSDTLLGIQWAKGTPQDLAPSSPNMTYHGGKTMPSANVTAIFWGTSWSHYTGDEIFGMDSWYQGFSNSSYARTSDEYTSSNGHRGSTTSYSGHYIDASAAGDGNNTGAILAEVCKMITNPDPTGNGYYPVYVDLDPGRNNYCSYHSYGTCQGVPVQFGFFFKLDGVAGCNPNDTSGLHSEGLAALANVSGHELLEARTDPGNPGGWFDAQGQENGDKCAWTYGAPLIALSNGTQWKLQGEWSNIAYNNGTGDSNGAGQKGCLSAPAPPSVTLTPFTVSFGNQPLGYPSDPIPVTLTNNQSVSLSITSIVTQSGHGEFSQTNNCGRSLSPHSSCTINVVFTPQVRGQHAGTLTVTDNGPGGSQYSSLGGIGGLQ